MVNKITHITVHYIDPKTKRKTHEDYLLSDPETRQRFYELLGAADEQFGPIPETPFEMVSRVVAGAVRQCLALLEKLLNAMWAGVKCIIRKIEAL